MSLSPAHLSPSTKIHLDKHQPSRDLELSHPYLCYYKNPTTLGSGGECFESQHWGRQGRGARREAEAGRAL